MIPAVQAFLLKRMRDLCTGCTTMPPAVVWRRCLVYYLGFLTFAVPIGFTSGLLRVQPLRVGSGTLLVLAAYLLVRPALVEELVFRGLLLPRDSSAIPRPRLLVILAVSLSLFVVSHPLNGILFRSTALGLFTNPWFLAVAALLGAYMYGDVSGIGFRVARRGSRTGSRSSPGSYCSVVRGWSGLSSAPNLPLHRSRHTHLLRLHA